MKPLSAGEQAVIDGVYARFGVVVGTPEQKCCVLQKFTGKRAFHCLGESALSASEFAALELRANERVYLLMNPRIGPPPL